MSMLRKKTSPSVWLVLFQIAVAMQMMTSASAQNNDARSAYATAQHLYKTGKYAEAVPYARRARDLIAKRFGRRHKHYALAQNLLATLHSSRFIELHKAGKYSRSEPHAEQALRIREQMLGRNHPHVAGSLHNLALLYETQGRFARAEPLYKRSLAIREKRFGRNHVIVANTLGNLAGLYWAQGRLPQAERLFRRALKIRKSALGRNHPDVATSLNNLGVLTNSRGLYAEAEVLYKQSLAIRETVLGPFHQHVATSLNNLAAIYKAQGRHAGAEPLYKRSLSISEKALGKNHPDVALSVNNLAELYRIQGRYAEAEPLYRRALTIHEKAFGNNHHKVATSLSNLATFFQTQGLFVRAEPLYEQSLAIREEVLGPNHPHIAISLGNLAEVYRSQGRYALAEPLYKKSLAIREKVFGESHPAVARILRNIGNLERDRHRWANAYASFQRAAVIHETRILGGIVSQRQATEIRQNVFMDLVDTAWQLAKQEPARHEEMSASGYKAAQWVGRTSTQAALGQMAARIGAGNAKLARDVRARQDLVREWQRLDKQLIKAVGARIAKQDVTAIAEMRAGLAALDKAISVLDARLERDFPEYAELANPKPLGISEARAFLGGNEALILYLVDGDQSFIWAMTREGISWERIGRKQSELEKDIAALRKSLDPVAAQSTDGRGLVRENLCRGFVRDDAVCEAYDTDLGRAHKLYQTLLGSVEQRIAGKRHLIIVPSGPLTGLPFHMLVSKTPPAGGTLDERFKTAEWLIRKHAVTVLPSVSSLRALRVFAGKGQAKRPFIGIGDPEFHKPRQRNRTRTRTAQAIREFAAYFRGPSADLDLLSRAMPQLPDTADELLAVGKVLKAEKSDIILGRRASETTLKALSVKGRLDDYRIVHFATHGLIAGQIKGLAEPALALSLPSKATEKDDGLLTASEVALLKLNADWVVLSACNTAAGDKPGAEALSGLARAFFYSGTRALLVSHWPVVSEAAVQLTTKTFASLKSDPTMGRAEALRQSMLSLIDEGKPYQRHPSYWAPFIIVGEGGSKGI